MRYIPDLTGLGAKESPSGFLNDELRRAQIGPRAKLSWATTMIDDDLADKKFSEWAMGESRGSKMT